jgi:ribose-phosphate pyrophosphokinase
MFGGGGSRKGLCSSDVARMLEAMGVDKIITVDIHSEQIEGFFGRDVPIDNVDVVPTFAKYINDNIRPKLEKRLVIASPDARGAPRYIYWLDFLS